MSIRPKPQSIVFAAEDNRYEAYKTVERSVEFAEASTETGKLSTVIASDVCLKDRKKTTPRLLSKRCKSRTVHVPNARVVAAGTRRMNLYPDR